MKTEAAETLFGSSMNCVWISSLMANGRKLEAIFWGEKVKTHRENLNIVEAPTES